MWLKGKSEELEPLRGIAVDEEILWQAERAAGLEAVIEAISAATYDASLYLTISDLGNISVPPNLLLRTNQWLKYLPEKQQIFTFETW